MMEEVRAWGEIGAVAAIIIFASWMLKAILNRLKVSDAMNDKMTVMLENHLTHIRDHMASTNEAMKDVVESQKAICDELKDLKEADK